MPATSTATCGRSEHEAVRQGRRNRPGNIELLSSKRAFQHLAHKVVERILCATASMVPEASHNPALHIAPANRCQDLLDSSGLLDGLMAFHNASSSLRWSTGCELLNWVVYDG